METQSRHEEPEVKPPSGFVTGLLLFVCIPGSVMSGLGVYELLSRLLQRQLAEPDIEFCALACAITATCLAWLFLYERLLKTRFSAHDREGVLASR